METAIDVSIIVPCHNHGHLLTDAVLSASTAARAAEVVVVNDGATDSTVDVMTSLEDRIRPFHQEQAGAAAARNRGLRESHGKYVVFLDADDVLAPNGLDIGAHTLDAHPESAFVFGRCRPMTAAGELMPTTAEPRMPDNHYRELLRRNFIGIPAMVMFRREAVERAGGFNPDVGTTSDYELYLHIARHHPVFDHGQVVAHQRVHDAALRVDVSRLLRDTLLVLRGQRPFLEGDDASLDAWDEGWRRWQELYGTRLADEMRAAAADGRWADAASRAIALARYDPRGAARQAARTLKAGRRRRLA